MCIQPLSLSGPGSLKFLGALNYLWLLGTHVGLFRWGAGLSMRERGDVCFCVYDKAWWAWVCDSLSRAWDTHTHTPTPLAHCYGFAIDNTKGVRERASSAGKNDTLFEARVRARPFTLSAHRVHMKWRDIDFHPARKWVTPKHTQARGDSVSLNRQNEKAPKHNPPPAVLGVPRQARTYCNLGRESRPRHQIHLLTACPYQ